MGLLLMVAESRKDNEEYDAGREGVERVLARTPPPARLHCTLGPREPEIHHRRGSRTSNSRA